MVAVIRDNQDPRQAEFLDELEFLAETADIVSVKRFTQRLPQPSARIHVGPGKLEEIAGYCREQQIDVVIFDDELSPSQTRNIEKAMPPHPRPYAPDPRYFHVAGADGLCQDAGAAGQLRIYAAPPFGHVDSPRTAARRYRYPRRCR